MLDLKIDFPRIYNNINEWKWSELEIGLEKCRISEKDVYAV